MTLQFFFDECADEDVARALLALGLDVVTVSDLKRKGLSDAEQFEFAKRENRVIYSTDHDFLKLTAEQMQRRMSFPGLASSRRIWWII
jgi:predicted nuclease of predicted toxin-antitoxin system